MQRATRHLRTAKPSRCEMQPSATVGCLGLLPCIKSQTICEAPITKERADTIDKMANVSKSSELRTVLSTTCR
ncbi:hypothetical protein CYLTODRAFT_22022 [Cylindrobasidium torrendii FP15055 ss-10]|uniref:Uncharacterized protein n=1 Tax=Cylindrobasidium torrendii FP15055 ss-10 TaxID=1314674 RepID=A0A0D7B9H6_9AGAR|nr:hypothetical protein CYLTODRAFT_22022 [Cylindrobasidium torrendii FP15055 ss-10]